MGEPESVEDFMNNVDSDTYDKHFWLYHCFDNKVAKTGRSCLTRIPKDPEGETIPIGGYAYQLLKQWYEGAQTKTIVT